MNGIKEMQLDDPHVTIRGQRALIKYTGTVKEEQINLLVLLTIYIMLSFWPNQKMHNETLCFVSSCTDANCIVSKNETFIYLAVWYYASFMGERRSILYYLKYVVNY